MRGIIFKGLLTRKLRFSIRLRGDRDLVLIDKIRTRRKKKKFFYFSQNLSLQKEGKAQYL